MQLACVDCGKTWQRETKPGKVPKRCPECAKRWCAEQGRLRERRRPLERRHGTVPCAGCGKLLYGSSTSLPIGERMCRPCRRERGRPCKPSDPARQARVVEFRRQGMSYARIGLLVGVSHETVGQDLKAAGMSIPAVRAPQKWARAPHPCEDCGTSTTRNSPRCKNCAAVYRQAANQRKNLKRRADGDPMSIRELAERDRWKCHLCRRRVSQRLRWPHPRSASRDHLMPVVDGGTNDPANLALAHLSCNVRRRAGGNVQLQLVG